MRHSTASLVATLACSHAKTPAPDGAPSPSSSEFANPEQVVIEGYTSSAQDPYLSADGEILLFDNRGDSTISFSTLQWARRVDCKTFTYVGPVSGMGMTASTSAAAPSMDRDGNLYFLSPEFAPGPSNGWIGASIATGPFSDGAVASRAPTEGLGLNRPNYFNTDAETSRDGQTMYTSDNSGDSTLFIATKNADGSFTRLSNSATLLAAVNNFPDNFDVLNMSVVYAPDISDDGLELFFSGPSKSTASVRVFRATRSSTTDAFAAPTIVATGDGISVEAPCLSADGKHLYYHDIAPGNSSVYVVTRP